MTIWGWARNYGRIAGAGVVILLATLAWAQAPEFKGGVHPGDSEIHRLCVADQADRRGIMSKPKSEWEQMAVRDLERRKRAKEIYYSGGLISAQDYFDAALILQHSDTPDDYLLAHVLCVVAITKGNTDAKWLSAATLDRYLQSVKQKQIFGTQYDSQGKNLYTNEPYNSALLTDAIRTYLDVPTIEQQKKDLESYNKSQPAKE